jgi:uroporphyrinogen decarboxylase
VKPLLDVLLNQTPKRRPIWIMRQAGRYLPEYKKVRQTAGSFLQLCYNPELACEVTLQPLRRFDLDAAILFSDILVVPHAMGLSLDFREGEGPVLETVSSLAGVERLRFQGSFDQFDRVWETVGLVRAGLASHLSLIGFCGAPWTVASYMIEGGSSDRKRALAVALENPVWFQLLLDKVVEASIVYLLGQVKAGAEALQIFDSWAGDLPPLLLERLVAKPIRLIVEGVRQVYPDFPIIVFARGVSASHGVIARATDANAVGVEEDVLLHDVLLQLPEDVAVQGNLSPQLLLGSDEALLAGIKTVLEGVPMKRHIFNLGHGITPPTDPLMLEKLVAAVRLHDAEFI